MGLNEGGSGQIRAGAFWEAVFVVTTHQCPGLGV